MLLVLSPLFIVVALLVKATSRGPVFFVQDRIGTNNRPFHLYKFRTMRVQSRQESDRIWTTKDDSRVTIVGRVLRKTNIDELPQFYNVLVGDMSVVGPRPEREFFADRFATEISAYRIRHLVRVGITGWAQVNGLRGDTSISERVKHDLYYLENWSFWFDVRIILKTVFGGHKNAM
jgi:lipopolysaccharide/colanic/teichoic acid biosynthesis glycosyltransferase